MIEVHIKESELVRDLSRVRAKVRQGVRVVVEEDGAPIAVINPPELPARSISGSIRLARQQDS